jgi:hypothetical protein
MSVNLFLPNLNRVYLQLINLFNKHKVSNSNCLVKEKYQKISALKKFTFLASFIFLALKGFTQPPEDFSKDFPEDGLRWGIQKNAFIWTIQKVAFSYPDSMATGNYTEDLRKLLIRYFHLNGYIVPSEEAPIISIDLYKQLARVDDNYGEIFNGKYKIHYKWASCYIESDKGDTSFYTLDKKLIGSKINWKEGNRFDLPPDILNSFTENCFEMPFGNDGVALFEAYTEEYMFVLLPEGTELAVEMYKISGADINNYLKGGVISLVLHGKYSKSNQALVDVIRDFRIGKLSRTKSTSSLKTDEIYFNSTSINSNLKSKSKCTSCSGTGRCRFCNVTFSVRSYDYNRKGWNTQNETRVGYIMCNECNGAGVKYGTSSGNSGPSSKKCHVSNCNNGWRQCSSCNYQGKGRSLGQCHSCRGTGSN